MATELTIDFDDTGMPDNINTIQSIIDSAINGDTLIFKGLSYGHIYLTINKALNIISDVGTTLSSCPSNSDKPIFTINEGGSGTNITGFTFMSKSEDNIAIFLNNTKNVLIKKNNISGSKIAIDAVNSNYTKIIGNTITNNKDGIIFEKNTTNNEITENNISKNKEHGIIFEGGEESTHNNIKITYNYLNDNEKGSGVYINSNFPNMNISSNMLTNNEKHGVYMGYGANKTDDSIAINNNYIMNNRGFNDFEVQRVNTSDEDRLVLKMGYNFFGTQIRSLISLCAKTSTGLMGTEIKQISNGLYRLSYINSDNKSLIENIIPHYVKVYLNKESTNVYVVNGTGIIDFRESEFKTTGNEVYTYYKYKDAININDGDVPKKSLDISTTANKLNVKNGDLVQYTTTVKNNGDKKVQNINISKMIPNFNINSYNVNIGEFDKKTGLWSIPILKSGEIAILKIDLKTNKASTYKTASTLTGDGFNLKSNELSLKVEDYVKLSSSNKIKKPQIKKNKSTFLISTIKNSGTISSKYLKVKVQLPKGVKLVSVNYKNKFNKNTKTWKIKIPSKNGITLQMKVKGTKKGKNKVVFNVNGKKETKYLEVY
ncbi:right-handed parallel beta-helix repeat-containing protein [Methanobrevibacter filiformis]|uniref:right-handed parallel beta-helix repeat-containing protein n=1 Tax=Methanobrevibacter filiformis TaxID=55758 RepID=UPI0012EDC7B6|nr:right-handed parallel beta-helix repeat-containing protein [Methanobrevibacter filiformis]